MTPPRRRRHFLYSLAVTDSDNAVAAFVSRSPGRGPWPVLAVNIVVIAQPSLAATMINIALPQLGRLPGMSSLAQTLLVSGYFLVSTVVLLTFGRIADLAGGASCTWSGRSPSW